MEDLEAKDSPNIKESADLSEGGEDREGSWEDSFGMSGIEI